MSELRKTREDNMNVTVLNHSASAAQPLVYRINVAMAKLGVSRTTIYRMVSAGNLTLVKISERASGITAESLLAYLERQKAAA